MYNDLGPKMDPPAGLHDSEYEMSMVLGRHLLEILENSHLGFEHKLNVFMHLWLDSLLRQDSVRAHAVSDAYIVRLITLTKKAWGQRNATK